MKWYRCAAACGIAKLFVRSALADFGETELAEDGNDFVGFEDRNIAHHSSDGYVLNTDKLGFQNRFAVFQKHYNNFVKVMVDFIQCFPLRMGARKAGDKADEQAGLWASLNYR